MKIHEYQAKELLASAGATVPSGVVVSSPAEAQQAFDKLGGPVVLKAQVHAGGRGKGQFKGSGKDWGGVNFVTKRDDVGHIAEVMFKYPLVTKQTDAEGQRVSRVLVVEAASRIAREIYVGVVLDRGHRPAHPDGLCRGRRRDRGGGGQDSRENPQDDRRPRRGLASFSGTADGLRSGLQGRRGAAGREDHDRPGQRLPGQGLQPCRDQPACRDRQRARSRFSDAKINFDDNALFRHPEIETLRDLTEENPAELRAGKAGLTYISLTGNIGCLVNGAGLAMSTMDIIKYHGGDPANFLDVGGGVTPEVHRGVSHHPGDPRVKGVLVNIFGGIAKCDLIAEALLKAGRRSVSRCRWWSDWKAPTSRRPGRSWRRTPELPMMETADGLTEAAKKVVAAAAKQK